MNTPPAEAANRRHMSPRSPAATSSARASRMRGTAGEPQCRQPPGPPTEGAPTRSERWSIWSAQLAAGREPCFATETRFVCDDEDCIWRTRCLRLRAEWLR